MKHQICCKSVVPDSPYWIPNGVNVGTLITLNGRVSDEDEEFSINLQESEDPEAGEIAFHLKVYPSSGECVRNSWTESWMEEETFQPYFPFLKGKTFNLIIEVAEKCIWIYVNDVPYISFDHRLDLSNIHYLLLSPGVEYYDITFDENFGLTNDQRLPCCMSPGKAILIQGTPLDEDGFSFSFGLDDNLERVAFFFNPIYKDGVAVMNSFLDEWGDEERSDGSQFPFNPNEDFTILFMAKEEQFDVFVNGDFFASFTYRCGLEDICLFHTDGNVNITYVEYFESMEEDFVKIIPDGMEEKDAVVLKGVMKSYGDSFSVNLLSGLTVDSDIVFHLNPRTSEEVIVMNSFVGDWGEEERDNIPCCFVDRTLFEIRLVFKKDKFKVYINDEKCASFVPQVDIEEIQAVNIQGDAFIYQAEIQKKQKKPFNVMLPGGLTPGKAIRFRGMTEKNDGFSINFKRDFSSEDTFFQFNPLQEERVVVMNANLEGWGDEERHFEAEFPFFARKKFDTYFVVQEEKFVVLVNNEDFVHFEHRNPPEDAEYFQVEGDVNIRDVECLSPLAEDFVEDIPEGLKKGDAIVLKGFMKIDGNSFSVNLLNGQSVDSDIAFHFNPRIDEGQIVMNSYLGDWGEEDRISLPACFSEHLPFEICFNVKKNKFKVYVNKKKCGSFEKRTDTEEIKGLNILGDVYIYQTKTRKKLDKHTREKIIGGLFVGDKIIINGCVKEECESFSVSLMCEDYEDGDIAFLFTPRFNVQNTARNSLEGDEWQEEETDQTCFPFQESESFELVIHVEADCFVTYVNGERYVDFKFRLPLKRICCIRLSGDAEFHNVDFS